jgi:putative hydrolase of the HAD superfamily
MKKITLILDLDETIFRTGSMDARIFSPFFEHLSKGLAVHFSKDETQRIINDLWLYTWDKVIEKHSIPLEIITPSISFLDGLHLDLDISPFPDYRFVKSMPHDKFLVTTSLTSLQNKKIDALGIRDDFKEIFINDTFITKKNKEDVFRELIHKYALSVESTIVVGDNAESEIRAGNALGMITVQMVREGTRKGDNAHHHISDFSALSNILQKLG